SDGMPGLTPWLVEDRLHLHAHSLRGAERDRFHSAEALHVLVGITHRILIDDEPVEERMQIGRGAATSVWNSELGVSVTKAEDGAPAWLCPYPRAIGWWPYQSNRRRPHEQKEHLA